MSATLKRVAREREPIELLAMSLLMQAVELANAGDLLERAWLSHDPMSETCFDVLGINPVAAREALVERWVRSFGHSALALPWPSSMKETE